MASEWSISTVYVQNLEERAKLELLKDALLTLFSELGTITEVVAKGNLRAKGQAFIVFLEARDAINAIGEIQGFPLFGKPMRLSMAHTPSDNTIKLRGSGDDLEQYKKQREEDKEKRKASQQMQDHKQLKLKRGAATGSDARPSKLLKPSAPRPAGATATVIPDEYLPPNKVLFIQNIPDDYDTQALTLVFARFQGFTETRLVPGRRGIAFVEYQSESGAIAAKKATDGMAFGDNKSIKVTYQRQ